MGSVGSVGFVGSTWSRGEARSPASIGVVYRGLRGSRRLWIPARSPTAWPTSAAYRTDAGGRDEPGGYLRRAGEEHAHRLRDYEALSILSSNLESVGKRGLYTWPLLFGMVYGGHDRRQGVREAQNTRGVLPPPRSYDAGQHGRARYLLGVRLLDDGSFLLHPRPLDSLTRYAPARMRAATSPRYTATSPSASCPKALDAAASSSPPSSSRSVS